MDNKGRDGTFKQSTEMLERVLADKGSHGLLSPTLDQNSSASAFDGLIEDIPLPDAGRQSQRVPEVIKNILTNKFESETDENDENDDQMSEPRLTLGNETKLDNFKNLPRNDNYRFSIGGSETIDQLQRENEKLRENLNFVEQQLLAVQTDRDNLAIRYNALNDRVKTAEASGKRKFSINTNEDFATSLNQQLRKQLETDNKEYRQKLAHQYDQQLKQADLIKKLQGKYQLTANDMNRRLEHAENKIKSTEQDRNLDLEALMLELKEEQAKAANLTHINILLRDQLDEATTANQTLTEELQKLGDEWKGLRDELEQRNQESREDDAAFNRYVTGEENRIKSLWNNFTNFKRQFTDVKDSNNRDIHQLRVDLEHSTQSLRLACANMETNTKNKISHLEFQLETERANCAQAEEALARVKEEQRRSEMQYQKQLESIKENFSQVNNSNEQLAKDLKEKEKILSTLHKLRNGIGGSDLEVLPDDSSLRQLIIDTDAVHQALRDISQLVMTDFNGSPADMDDMFGPDDTLEGNIDGSGQLRQTMSINSLHSNRSNSPMRKQPAYNSVMGSLDRQQRFAQRSRSPVAMADTTCAAVRSALQKRALQVQELSSRLNNTKQSSAGLKRSLEESENERRQLEKQFIELRREYDSNHRELDDIQRECERQKNTIVSLEEDKIKLEKLRSSVLEEGSSLKQEYDKLKTSHYELQRDKDSYTDKYHDLEKNLERQMREMERLQKQIEATESKNSKLREEVATLREMLNKLVLEKDVLEQEKSIVQESLNKNEMIRADIEVKTNKMRTEEAKLKDKLIQLESQNHNLGKENSELKIYIDEIESEKKRLFADKSALEQEKYGIREELLRVENEKEELNQVKDGLHYSMQNVEKSYEMLSSDVIRLNQEKAELESVNSSLQRERNSLSNEMLQARRDAERLSAAVQKLMKEKETINKERLDIVAQVKLLEREIRENSDTIYMLQEEKDQLENTLYDSKQLIQQFESQLQNFESNLQQVEQRRSALHDEKQRMQHDFDIELQKLNKARECLQNRLNETELDWSKKLQMEKKERESDIERLVMEREELQMEFAKYKESTNLKYQEEMDRMKKNHMKEREEFGQEITAIQRERDDTMLELEMSKQHAINIMEQEKISLIEKNGLLNENNRSLESELDRIRQEGECKAMQDLETIQVLSGDLKKLRLQFEQIHVDHEKEIKMLQASIKDLESQKYQEQREAEELKSLLKIAEETRDTLRQDLSESYGKYRDLEENREKLRRELQEEKRNYFEEKRECDTLQTSNKDLRQKLKQIEMTKIDMQRQIQELQSNMTTIDDQRSAAERDFKETKYSLQETEKARAEARRELEELRSHVKKLDLEKGKLENEVGNLQVRISSDENKEVEARREFYGLRQKVMETEASKEELSKQLNLAARKLDELEDNAKSKDRIFKQDKEEMLKEIKQLSESKHSLEVELENATSTVDDLRNELAARESRINALEHTLTVLDQKRKGLEMKLSSIHAHLRKLIGYRQQALPGYQAGTLSLTRNRSPSPAHRSRSVSPDKGRVSSRASVENYGTDERRKGNFKISADLSYVESTVPGSDLDPEAVRLALRDVTQHIVNMERQIDDYEIKVKNLNQKNEDTATQLDQALKRISELQRNFGEVEEDKRGVDSRLLSVQTAIMMQEETINRNERERKNLMDKVTKLERQLSATENEKRYLQEKIDKIRNSETHHEEEKRGMIKALDDAENRCTQLELMRRGLEGDLQRLKMAFTDKETENQVLVEQGERLTKQISDLESKAQNLQLTIDRLSINLSRTEEGENTQKDKVQQLSMTLTEHQGTLQSLKDKNMQLQSSLTSSEHDRRVLQERLDSLRQSLSESKSQNHTLTDKMQILQQEMADCESRKKELESEAKRLSTILSQRQEAEHDMQTKLHKMAAEKNLLTERLNGLTASLAGLENERRDMEKMHNRTEKEKYNLKKNLDKLEKEKNRTEEYVNQNILKREEFNDVMRKLEADNDILHHQVQKLQTQLADAEQSHAQRLLDLSTRIKSEMLSEIDRLKSALCSTEKTLQYRERSHRQKVKSMEEQINTLKDQLTHELRKREAFLNKSARLNAADIDLFRSNLDYKTQLALNKHSVDNLLQELESQRPVIAQDSSLYDAGYSTCASPSSTLKQSATSGQPHQPRINHHNATTTRLDSLPRAHSPNRLMKSSNKRLSKQKLPN